MTTIESFIVGNLLGDGWFTKENNHTLFFQHSTKQADYARYKEEIAKELGLQTHFYNINVTEHRKFPAVRVTVRLPNDLYKYFKHKFYPNNNKTITRHLLNYLDNTGLAIWYQDDGSLSVYTNPNTQHIQRHIKWCTEGFNYDEHVILQRYLKSVWDIDSNIRPEKHKYYFLWLGAISAKKLFSNITVCPNMSYKVDLKYFVPRSNPTG